MQAGAAVVSADARLQFGSSFAMKHFYQIIMGMQLLSRIFSHFAAVLPSEHFSA